MSILIEDSEGTEYVFCISVGEKNTYSNLDSSRPEGFLSDSGCFSHPHRKGCCICCQGWQNGELLSSLPPPNLQYVKKMWNTCEDVDDIWNLGGSTPLTENTLVTTASPLIIQKLNSFKFSFFLIGGSRHCRTAFFPVVYLSQKSLYKRFYFSRQPAAFFT